MKLKATMWLLMSFLLLAASTATAGTTVEFWTTETQSDRMKVIETLAQTFEALNPDIDIKVVPVDENEVPTQIAAAMAAGTQPKLSRSSPSRFSLTDRKVS